LVKMGCALLKFVHSKLTTPYFKKVKYYARRMLVLEKEL